MPNEMTVGEFMQLVASLGIPYESVIKIESLLYGITLDVNSIKIDKHNKTITLSQGEV